MNQQAFQTVVILIKDADRIDDGLRTGRMLLQAGVRVRIFLLGSKVFAANEDRSRRLRSIQQMGAETLTDHTVANPQYCDVIAPIDQMADGLLEANAVITF